MADKNDGGNRVPLTIRDFFFQDPFFQNSWDDFDKIRQDMMKESKSFWTRVNEQETKMVEQSKADPSQPQEGGFPMDLITSPFSPMVFPRRWMFPRFLSRDDSEKMFPSDFFNFKREEDQVLRIKEDESNFELSLDTHEYRPDEIKVNVNGNMLSVEAKHEEKGENKFVSRQFARKYTLPEGCDPLKVSSNLSSDGILMITAPKNPAIKGGAQAVPVEMKQWKAKV